MTDESKLDEDFLLQDEGTEMERLLLRSAELDQGSQLVEQRVLRALRDTQARPSTTRESRVWLYGGLGLVASALLALTLGLPGAKTEVESAQISSEDLLKRPTDAGDSPARNGAAPEAQPQAGSAEGLVVDPCAKAARAAGNDPRIDLISEAKSSTREVEGRFGSWFVDNDKTGLQQPAPGAEWRVEELSPKVPSFALHTSGSAFSKWGATVGVNFAGGTCYDASIYDGVVIDARGPARISVILQTMDVVPVEEGGSCVRGCYASHYKKLQLGGKFERHQVRFDELVQHTFGSKVDFDPARLRSVIFQVAAEDSPFDFAISEVLFLKKSSKSRTNPQ